MVAAINNTHTAINSFIFLRAETFMFLRVPAGASPRGLRLNFQAFDFGLLAIK